MDHTYVYKPANYIRNINHPEFIASVAKHVEVLLGRKITVMEKRMVKNYIIKLRPSVFKGYTLQKALNTLAEIMSKKIKKTNCEENYMDMHEYAKKEIGVSGETGGLSFDLSDGVTSTGTSSTPVTLGTSVDILRIMGASNTYKVQQLLNPQALHRHNYFPLDSRYRVLDNDGSKFISWNHVNNVTRAQGTVNTVGTIRDIIAVKVYPIRMPYTATAENNLRRVTMLIEEFSAQSFLGQENRRFHFVFDVEIDGDWIRLNPYFHNQGIYRFDKPITQFDTITISFGSPLEEVVLDVDRLNTSNTYATTAILTTISSHNLSSGNKIYISDFNTNSPVNDAVVISEMNTSHIVTVTGDTTFTIPVDTSSIVNSSLTGTTVSVTNGVAGVVGTGTAFDTELKVNDIVKILGISYTIATITNATNMTLSTVYGGATNAALAIASFVKDNSITNLSYTVYFNSKRMFIPMELTFKTPEE